MMTGPEGLIYHKAGSLPEDKMKQVRETIGILKNNRGTEEHLVATSRAERGIARHSQ
jgi:hypothetical protein